MTLVIGLTGGIASGKSTVSTMLKEKGYTVIDADIESRLAVEIGEKAYNEIVATFGSEILLSDGTIDRAKLGSIIFHDKDLRIKLNDIVHPAVRKRILDKKENAVKKNEKLVVMDIPLLIESKLEYMVDKILLIYVDEQTQLERLMERNHFSKEEALARITSQMPLQDKRKFADEIIENDGTIQQTKDQLEKVLEKWDIV